MARLKRYGRRFLIFPAWNGRRPKDVVFKKPQLQGRAPEQVLYTIPSLKFSSRSPEFQPSHPTSSYTHPSQSCVPRHSRHLWRRWRLSSPYLCYSSTQRESVIFASMSLMFVYRHVVRHRPSFDVKLVNFLQVKHLCRFSSARKRALPPRSPLTS